jgi:hypothetical protein
MNWKTLIRRVGELSPGCKDAVRLQSAELDRPLTPTEKFGLRFHLVLCKWCHSYGKQIKFLHSAAKDDTKIDTSASTQPTLSSEARERIKRHLQSGV